MAGRGRAPRGTRRAAGLRRHGLRRARDGLAAAAAAAESRTTAAADAARLPPGRPRGRRGAERDRAAARAAAAVRIADEAAWRACAGRAAAAKEAVRESVERLRRNRRPVLRLARALVDERPAAVVVGAGVVVGHRDYGAVSRGRRLGDARAPRRVSRRVFFVAAGVVLDDGPSVGWRVLGWRWSLVCL